MFSVVISYWKYIIFCWISATSSKRIDWMNSNMDPSKENDDQYPTTEVGKGDEIIPQ